MKRIEPRELAIEGVITRHGTLVGPLMAELTGFPELTPYDGGWCGNDVSPDVLRTRMRAPESFIIPNDGHPNERGSELIARAAWPFIRKKLHEFCARRPAEAMVATGDEADRDDGRATLVRTGGAAGRCLQPDHAD